MNEKTRTTSSVIADPLPAFDGGTNNDRVVHNQLIQRSSSSPYDVNMSV